MMGNRAIGIMVGRDQEYESNPIQSNPIQSVHIKALLPKGSISNASWEKGRKKKKNRRPNLPQDSSWIHT